MIVILNYVIFFSFLQKILQEGGGTGYIILGIYNGLDNTPNESSTDAPSISCNEDWQFISGPPSPCNIQFEGDNVVINGKSNLRKQPKEKKVKRIIVIFILMFLSKEGITVISRS